MEAGARHAEARCPGRNGTYRKCVLCSRPGSHARVSAACQPPPALSSPPIEGFHDPLDDLIGEILLKTYQPTHQIDYPNNRNLPPGAGK